MNSSPPAGDTTLLPVLPVASSFTPRNQIETSSIAPDNNDNNDNSNNDHEFTMFTGEVQACSNFCIDVPMLHKILGQVEWRGCTAAVNPIDDDYDDVRKSNELIMAQLFIFLTNMWIKRWIPLQTMFVSQKLLLLLISSPGFCVPKQSLKVVLLGIVFFLYKVFWDKETCRFCSSSSRKKVKQQCKSIHHVREYCLRSIPGMSALFKLSSEEQSAILPIERELYTLFGSSYLHEHYMDPWMVLASTHKKKKMVNKQQQQQQLTDRVLLENLMAEHIVFAPNDVLQLDNLKKMMHQSVGSSQVSQRLHEIIGILAMPAQFMFAQLSHPAPRIISANNNHEQMQMQQDQQAQDEQQSSDNSAFPSPRTFNNQNKRRLSQSN